jgi:hypothetical protein
MDTTGRKIEASTVRDVMPSRGARFFRDPEGALMFTFVIDRGNIIGPRPATINDARQHGEALRDFAQGDAGPLTDADFAQLGMVKVAPAVETRALGERDGIVATYHRRSDDTEDITLERPGPKPKRKYTRRSAA